jgi:3-deoxy-7-phosphoheptulonate synthase
MNWNPHSYKNYHAEQQVSYTDKIELGEVVKKLENLPPLVGPKEIENLRFLLKEVSENKRFLLQGGDCAEMFNYCTEKIIENKIKVLVQMSLILTWGAKIPIVKIARMAGQYAKPRSNPFEIVNNIRYNAFRGDSVNSVQIDKRTPDPQRLISAYFHSSATINFAKLILSSGYSDLLCLENLNSKSDHWNFDFVRSPCTRHKYDEVIFIIN